jgi:hypothetical protein
MLTFRKARFASLLAVALALVVTGAVAGAAGEALIVGQSNTAGANQTHLTANLSKATLKLTQLGLGSPLSLKGSTNKPPMVVNSSQKVLNLNADRVDGKSAGAFLPSPTYRQSTNVTIAAGGSASFDVSCDAGDQVLSGGYLGKHRSTNLLDSLPSAAATFWTFSFVNRGTGSDSVIAYALCSDFAPRHGAVVRADVPPRD